MSSYKTYSGYTSLQTDLMKLLNGVAYNTSLHSSGNESNDSDTSNEEITANTTDVISDVVQNHFEEQYEIDTDITGGADIVGLVSNILEGGGLTTQDSKHTDEPEVITTDATLIRDPTNNITSQVVSTAQESNPIKNIVSEVLETKGSNKETDGQEVISNIFLEDSNHRTQDDSYHSSSSSSEEVSDDSDEDDTKYAEIIKDIRSAQYVSKANLSLKGGAIKSPNNVRIINAYPWILKSSS